MRFYKDESIRKIGEAYCGFKIKNTMTMANRVIFEKNNKGSGNGWHKDAYRPKFKSMLYLNKVDEKNGAFQFIKNSNSLINVLRVATKLIKTYPDTRFTDEEINKISDINNIMTLKGKPGTLVLFDATLIHRGMPLKNFSRYALTNYYESTHNFENALSSIEPYFAANTLTNKLEK